MREIAVLVASSLFGFLGFCIYWDHRKRKTSEYKEEIIDSYREKELAEMIRKHNSSAIYNVRKASIYSKCQANLAEDLALIGSYENASIHFVNAMDYSLNPAEILMQARRCLPNDMFNEIVRYYEAFLCQNTKIVFKKPVSIISTHY